MKTVPNLAVPIWIRRPKLGRPTRFRKNLGLVSASLVRFFEDMAYGFPAHAAAGVQDRYFRPLRPVAPYGPQCRRPAPSD